MSLDDEIDRLYFDGKDDLTLTNEGKDKDLATIKEHHISITLHNSTKPAGSGENGMYAGFVKSGGKGSEMAVSMLNYLDAAKIDYSSIQVVGCDGTNSNTGWKDGCVTNIERLVGHYCTWAICMCHHVELPLRRLFEQLDGVTQDKWQGPIGRIITTKVHKLPVGKFEIIEVPDFPVLPEETLKKLSNDTKYLYRICRVVITGNENEGLLKQKIGKAHTARWLTLSSRICRVYVSGTCNSDPNLKRLVNYIVHVYFKVFINAKHKSSIIDGPVHLLTELKSINKACTKEEVKIVFPSVQNNAYYAHPENVLIAMLGSQVQEDRAEAINIITDLRKFRIPRQRKFFKPAVRRNPYTVKDLPIWKIEHAPMETDNRNIPFSGQWVYLTQHHGYQLVREPRVTMKFTMDQLKEIENVPLELDFPNHTQSVERAVALTSASVKRLTGEERQRNSALATSQSRNRFKGPITKRLRL